MKSRIGIFCLAVIGCGVARGEDAGVAFFRDEVKPLLAENCCGCHGGENDRGKIKIKSGLQLISRRGLLQGGDHGPAFNESEPSKSYLLEMVSYKDGDHQMPPRGKLKPGQLETLAKWVEMGAPWTPEDAEKLVVIEEEHEGPSKTEINQFTTNYWSYRPMVRPDVSAGTDGGNEIDVLLGRSLDELGLKANGRAGKAELVRRVYYDLTGLAPTPEEVAAFCADDRSEAWGELVDRLLASPQYGVKWGRHWLDIVRYADSNGFERDSEKEYIWRYRDYVVEAFNSDKPYDVFLREQIAGDEVDSVTGESMVATGFHRLMQWDDEPADRLQHLYDVLDDDLRVVSEGVLGMTLGCARCHDHKGDPLSQKEYFQFMAFFHGMTPMGKGSVVEEVALPPGQMDIARWKQESERKTRDLKRQIEKIEEVALGKLREIDPGAFEKRGGTEILVASGEKREDGALWDYTTAEPGDGWSAVGFRPGKGWKKGRGAIGAGAAGKRSATRVDPGDIWMQTTFLLEEIPAGLKMRVFHDDGAEIYLNGERVAALKGHVSEYTDVKLERAALGVLQTGRNVVSVHCRYEGGGQLFDLELAAGEGEIDPALLIAERGDDVLKANEANRYRDLKKQYELVTKSTGPTGAKAIVVRENGAKAPDLHVHIRGNASSKGEKVEPGFPAIFGGDEVEVSPRERSSGRRRALVDWITAEDNRRTARVMVNRMWQHHFGVGLCPTPNDFGFLGEEVSHPELLDWLATEFVSQGWSMKAMHRTMLHSNAYRMSSAGQPEGLGKDPENRMLWRFNMRRLSAEEIRDSMLQVAGLLNLKQGGPGIYVPMPEAVLSTSSKGAGMWGRSSDEDARRRSIYIKVKRSLKPPEFSDFDFADTDSSCPVRFTTTVPTQALHMLNSEFINKQAAQFAERLRKDREGDLRGQVEFGLGLALSREAEASEVDYCIGFMNTVREKYGLDESKALERFCLLALNLNEFVYLD